MRTGVRSGQAMLEYVLAFASLAVVSLIFLVLMAGDEESGESGLVFRFARRVTNLVASEHP